MQDDTVNTRSAVRPTAPFQRTTRRAESATVGILFHFTLRLFPPYTHVSTNSSWPLKCRNVPPETQAELLPCVISFTVSLSVSDKTGAGLVQVLAALCAFEAGRVPLQVRGDPQDVLVVYLTSTAHTHGDSRLLCVTGGGGH